MVAGVNEKLTSAGKPLTVRATAALNPLNGVAVIGTETEAPCMTLALLPVRVNPADELDGITGYAFTMFWRNSV
jgi:hypothetical protein